MSRPYLNTGRRPLGRALISNFSSSFSSLPGPPFLEGQTLEQGVEGVVILDGKVPHAVLLELLTDLGAGTLITR